MSEAPSLILAKMLDRLFASITSGPSLNCRPHSSRQRVDLAQFSALGGATPGEALAGLLRPQAVARIVARDLSRRAPEPLTAPEAGGAPPGTGPGARRMSAPALLAKLRVIADEARIYEDDTGVHVLNIGFPLLSLPAGSIPGAEGGRPDSRRVLAPIAFIPVSLTIRGGAATTVELVCREDEVDRVKPNEALLAWIEQQTGIPQMPELFADESGTRPWREICEIAAQVGRTLQLDVPESLRMVDTALVHAGEPGRAEGNSALAHSGRAPAMEPPAETVPVLDLLPAPHASEIAGGGGRPGIVLSAVLGLFPMANQGLLRDTQAMLAGETLEGPVLSFLRSDVMLGAPAPVSQPAPPAPAEPPAVPAEGDERLVAPADPFQARAVALARRSAGLVIHGPPGTGKSQTITNIIADHLARGEHVLFVCDKRTALDVVASRLEHLGLGSLCALVHDPQRDQKDLYRAVRDQLEALDDVRTGPDAETELVRADQELAKVHAELSSHWQGLMARPSGGGPPPQLSLHELVGCWLAIEPAQLPPCDELRAMRSTSLAELEARHLELRDLLRRADEAKFPDNPWARSAGIELGALLARPAEDVRAALERCANGGAAADAAIDPVVPPFDPRASLADQAQARAALAARLETAIARTPEAVRRLWAARDPDAALQARRELEQAAPAVEILRSGPLDAELALLLRERAPSMADVAAQLGCLEGYLAAQAWYGFLLLPRRWAGAKLLRQYGLAPRADSARRLRRFLEQVRAAGALRSMLARWTGISTPGAIPDPPALSAELADHERILSVLALVREPSLAVLAPAVLKALCADVRQSADLFDGLRRSPPRAEALAAFEDAMLGAGLFDGRWLEASQARWRAGDAVSGLLADLRARLPTVEDVLRVRAALAGLPQELGDAVRRLIAARVPPPEAESALRRCVLAGEIETRLKTAPELRTLDARRVETLMRRYRELEARRRALVRDAILHRWVSRHRQRLLVGTGSRLNSFGADLRRRLATRGARAMRLRQVLAFGRDAEGGDPIMDLRPVWMASPETVAEIFPRRPIFDVLVFDEASQCRLEEAIPVLTRARRVVIAGDPRQLPPTRFFETVVAESEAGEIETEQELFEAQQSEVEDLLGAALGLDVDQCHLDVHYRSRSADLIAFSNEHFYSSRLQPIPGPPRTGPAAPPLALHQVAGVYLNRVNQVEADEVCRIVRELLLCPEAPSIGVACFNVDQRDLIAERLEEFAEQDPELSRRLAAARQRRGDDSAEPLFVKNLENVQGDERDHIIISTTYGCDPSGRFFRRFGPLGMAGGGRRLNVLVTRARSMVHLVTSIPPEVYRSLPPIPPGQTPGGGWLLLAYLRFAEHLSAASGAAAPSIAEGSLPRESAPRGVRIRPTTQPSPLAEAIAARVAHAADGVVPEVYWGNDGFCIDVVVRARDRAHHASIGLLCDGARFRHGVDPVEWDIFRSAIFESQGWRLLRLWSPAIYRDAQSCADLVLRRVEAS
jgi:hypothetical protein